MAKRTLVGYKTYLFKDKDPVIDVLREALRASGRDLNAVAAEAGVSPTTLCAWFYGLTRRPQFATTQAVARALGMEFSLRQRQARQASVALRRVK